jgi:Methyltransferase domain
MIQTQERTERLHRHWDKKSRSAPTTARCASLSESPTRCWAYSQASGDVDEVASARASTSANPPGVRLTAVDPSEQMPAIASTRARARREVELRQGDAHSQPFADARFESNIGGKTGAVKWVRQDNRVTRPPSRFIAKTPIAT